MSFHKKIKTIVFILLCVFLVGCDDADDQLSDIEAEQGASSVAEMVLTPVSFEDLPDWGQDNFQNFKQSFLKSCDRIKNIPPDRVFGVMPQAGTYGDWQDICIKMADLGSNDDLQSFFENYFIPYAIREGDDPIGLFTGYYEASLKGALSPKDPYTVPLHLRPEDLVMVDLGQFRDALKGQRIAGRVQNGNLRPYEDRSQIVSGDWQHNDHVLVWVDDPVDAFFVQIQGSGLVTLDDGTTMRIGYAGQNGHPYYAIGRELIKRGVLTKETVSMQSIRAWLSENPDQAEEVMNTNASYVFFREIDGDGPVGAQGASLTAGRSLAIDRTKISYGVPLWVDIEHPVKDDEPIRKMMVAQDTGGAIVGAVRGDYFWGYGDYAEDMAGVMKSEGRYWALFPR